MSTSSSRGPDAPDDLTVLRTVLETTEESMEDILSTVSLSYTLPLQCLYTISTQFLSYDLSFERGGGEASVTAAVMRTSVLRERYPCCRLHALVWRTGCGLAADWLLTLLMLLMLLMLLQLLHESSC
jgi:hypothetical protein